MTVISAVTYLTGAVLSPTPFSTQRFLRGWLFILLCQFATHFLGEVFDAASDTLNRHATPLTGGSRVLPAGQVTPALALRAGLACAALAAASIVTVLPHPARPVAFAMLAMAVSYSAPPLKLNHCGLGELDAAVVTNVLVPYFAFAAQGAVDGRFPWYDRRLDFLVLPPFFVKISLFLVLNLADRRPDWATGKVTLPVVLGTRRTALLHAALMTTAYMSAMVLAAVRVLERRFLQWSDGSVLLFILPSAPYGFAISAALLRGVPYRLDHLLAPTVLHSTMLVWGVLFHAMLSTVANDGLLNFQTAFAAGVAYITVTNVLKGKRPAAKKTDEKNNVADPKIGVANGPFSVVQVFQGKAREGSPHHIDPLAAAEEGARKMSSEPVNRDIVIVGGGVGGLVAAAALTKMDRSVMVLERRASPEEAESGADLALWPGAIAILKGLGVASDFFEKDCFPLEKVHMCNMDFEQMNVDGDGEAGSAATILKTIDMAEVTEGTGEHFVLLPRQSLMDALRSIVPADVVVYGADVVDLDEDEDNDCVTTTFSLNGSGTAPVEFTLPQSTYTVSSRIVIGADGARSSLRSHVSPDLGGADSIRFCGEVCYRGVLNLASHVNSDPTTVPQLRDRITALFPDKASDRTMRINYGAGLRSSFGYMSADGEVAYWWVKVQMNEMPSNRGKLKECNWPEPLKTLHDLTPDSAFYMHPIEDSRPLPQWSSPRVVLVGDAAHVVTPNMGQGACLATEDAFVLATELVTHWRWPDGHLEAFYNYEQTRRPYADAVGKESRKQLFLGQLSSRPAVFLRELLLQLVPASVLQKSLKQNNFSVQPYLDVLDDTARDDASRSS